MRKIISLIIVITFLAATNLASAKTWFVGSSRTYTAPSKVMGLVADGDSVSIDAGLYSGDVGTWTKSYLFIYCPNGMAHLDAAGQNAGGKGIWVVDGNHTKIENIEFSGVTVADMNGAGIRLEGIGLELRHCYFHDNDEGVLAGDNTGHDSSDVLFEACEFDHNGYGDGYSHNMYINHLRNFTVKFCYIHRAKVGHNIKSRAYNTYILYNRIEDDSDGTASYSIDLPNGGNAYLIGNSIQKGAQAENHTIITFGEEGLTNPAKQLFIVNNTIVSENSKAIFISVPASVDSGYAENNIYEGPGTLYNNPIITMSNLTAGSANGYLTSWKFFDTRKYDYRISSSSQSLEYGQNPGSVNGFSLAPTMQYVHPTDSVARLQGSFYLGAFDWITDGVSLSRNSSAPAINYPNPFATTTTITLNRTDISGMLRLVIFDALGRVCSQVNIIAVNNALSFDRRSLPSGMYGYVIYDQGQRLVGNGKFVVQ